MSVVKYDDFMGEPTPIKCELCGKTVKKWINIVPGGDLCINCAQSTMRILFQDIIEYHNGTPVSLLNIMHHGKKDMHGRRLDDNLNPAGHPRDDL
jgi:hypothetical protein